jgi:hypothetical protein
VTVRSEDWLAGAASHSVKGADGDAVPHVRLSELEPHQKRELAGFGLAAVTTCGFLLMPLLLATDEAAAPRLIAPEVTIARAAPAPGAAAAPAVVAPSTTATAAEVKKRGPSRRRAQRNPPLRGEKLTSPVVILADARQAAATPRSDRSGSRRLVARVLLGDGRYRVRPFPTPSAEEN